MKNPEVQALLNDVVETCDIPELGRRGLEGSVKRILDRLVARTDTPIDDMLANSLYSPLKEEMLKELTKFWLGLKEVAAE